MNKNFSVNFFILFCICILSLSACAGNKSAFYMEGLQSLIQEQADAKTITAKITHNPRIPKMTNVNSNYFLSDLLAKIDEMPPDQIPAFEEWVMQNAEKLPSPVLLELARIEFTKNKRKGLEWFFRGWVNLVYDAQRCKDFQALNTPLQVLSQRQKSIRAYVELHREESAVIQDKIYQEEIGRNYTASPIWVCASSAHAVKIEGNTPLPVDVKELMYPKEMWPRIRQETEQLLRRSKIEKQASR